MIALDEDSGWHGVSKDEWTRLRPYILDCADLSASTRKRVREEFRNAGFNALQKLTTALGRILTQDEVDMVRAELTRHFNNVRIAQIANQRGE